MASVTFGLAGVAARTLDPRVEGYCAALHDAVELAILAEEVGFDTVWTGEHHGAVDGYMPAPLVFLAALAMRTTRIQLGTNVLLAPLWDPRRLYEEAAVVDQLSNGRLVLGLAVGYRTDEFDAFDIPMFDRVARLEAAVYAIRTRGAVRDSSMPLTPLPWQQPGPEIWLGGFVRVAVKRAARIAAGYIAPTVGASGLVERIAWLEPSSLPDGFSIGVTVIGFVHDGVDTADADAVLADLGMAGGSQPAAPRPADSGERIIAVGSPSEVAAALAPLLTVLSELPDRLRAHIAIQLTTPAVSAAGNHRSVELFAGKVRPLLDKLTRANLAGGH